MKAFLLAAGNGTRLRPLTADTPKCLLPIRGVPLLQIWLENCRRAGVDEVLVNIHAHAEKIHAFAHQQTTGVKLRIVEEESLLGSAGTLAENQEFVKGENAFFILYGDVLTNLDLASMLREHATHAPLATLATHRVHDPTQCGIVMTDSSGVITDFIEKPELPRGDCAFSGIMIASQGVFSEIPAHRPADVGFHVLPKLVGRMRAFPLQGFLMDIGTLKSYAAAQETWPGR